MDIVDEDDPRDPRDVVIEQGISPNPGPPKRRRSCVSARGNWMTKLFEVVGLAVITVAYGYEARRSGPADDGDEGAFRDALHADSTNCGDDLATYAIQEWTLSQRADGRHCALALLPHRHHPRRRSPEAFAARQPVTKFDTLGMKSSRNLTDIVHTSSSLLNVFLACADFENQEHDRWPEGKCELEHVKHGGPCVKGTKIMTGPRNTSPNYQISLKLASESCVRQIHAHGNWHACGIRRGLEEQTVRLDMNS